MSYKLIECVQGTPEWFAARAGVITASKFADAISTLKNGTATQASKDYAYKVAVERIYGETTDDTYQTFEMRRGSDLEPIARMAYERITGNLAEESGVALTEDDRFGYSTDGLIGSDGLIEIKCPNSARKLVEMWETEDLSEYMHQIQGGMWITGHKWCDFVMYAPQLQKVDKQLFIKRVLRDDDFIETMQISLMQFKAQVDHHVANLNKKAA